MCPSRIRPFLVAGALALASGCINENEKESPLHGGGTSPETSTYGSESAKVWFDLLTSLIDAENLNPPEASRVIGYAGVTFYEAVVQGMPDHMSLGEQLNGLGELPEVDDGLFHWPSVANAAMSLVLTDLFAGAQASTLQAILTLEAQLAAQFAVDENPNVLARSVAQGQDLAGEITDWIADDGFTIWNDCAFTPPMGDGLWVPTPPGFVPNPLEPCWGNLRPFVLLFGAQCAPLAPPPFSRTAGSGFANEALEVYNTVNTLDATQMEIATFWADGAGSLTPPGHWVSITGQVLEQEGEDLDVAAEAYAKVGIGVADAFISCWEIKYFHNLLRPVTYIQDPLGPINDPAWMSFITTPPFPEFTSGHSTQSGAAAALLTDLLGNNVSFVDDTYAAVPLPPRTFNSFDEAAQEAAISRLYGGIHYRAAIERGLDQGRCVAQTILQDVQFLR